jgi:hypothetical protein
VVPALLLERDGLVRTATHDAVERALSALR